MATKGSIVRLFVVAGVVAVGGCAADQPSKPMMPAAKPSPASSASTAMRGALQTLSKPAATAAKPAPPRDSGASRTASAAAPKPSIQAKPAVPAAAPSSPSVSTAPAPARVSGSADRAPSPVVAASKPIVAQPRADAPAATPAAPSPSTSTAAAPAIVTADFSTGLLFPDPDPATAATREIALCEFIGGRWTPIMTAPVQTYGGDTRGVTFRGVLARRMVLPAYIVNGAARPAANPWIIESSGKVRELKGPCATCPSTEPPILTLELRPAEGADAAPMTAESGDYGVIAVRAQPGRRFTLSYWDNAWVPIGDVTLTAGQPERIEGVPSKRVLWLKSENDSLTLPVVP